MKRLKECHPLEDMIPTILEESYMDRIIALAKEDNREALANHIGIGLLETMIDMFTNIVRVTKKHPYGAVKWAKRYWENEHDLEYYLENAISLYYKGMFDSDKNDNYKKTSSYIIQTLLKPSVYFGEFDNFEKPDVEDLAPNDVPMLNKEQPYVLLSNAVITRAVYDYRNALRGSGYERIRPEDVIADCEQFFLSQHIKCISNINGKALLERLRKEFEDESNTNSSNA